MSVSEGDRSMEIKLFSALSFLKPESLKNLSSHILVLIERKLWAKILFAMMLGVITGFLVSQNGPFSEILSPHSKIIDALMGWLVLPAKFFLKLIQMVIIPLIFSSIIRGLASTDDVEQMKSLGLRFSLFVLVTTLGSAFLGVFVTKVINPGEGLNLIGAKISSDSGELFSLRPDSLLDILPVNPLASLVSGQMLEVVIIAIIGGIAFLSIQKDQSKVVMDTLEVIQNICMTVIGWAMKLAPIAVFGMMAQVSATTGLKSLENMLYYVVSSFLGFAIILILFPVTVWLVRKESPIKFLKSISTPLLLAFSTSSSAATMPVSMKIAEEELDINPSVARFLIPLGSTINMAGSAIWHTSAILFISQAYGLELSLAQIGLVVATSVGSAIGSPGVPGVGVGVLAGVLASIGIPPEGLTLILGVDRIVDMGCTVVNVAGNLTACKLFGPSKFHS